MATEYPIMRIVIQGETPAKKNSRITLPNGRSIPGKRYQEWHEAALPQVLAQLKGTRPLLDEPCEAALSFFHGDYRRCDCDNGASSILDLLVDAGILSDDNWKIVRSLKVANHYDKGNPRCEIEIRPLPAWRL